MSKFLPLIFAVVTAAFLSCKKSEGVSEYYYTDSQYSTIKHYLNLPEVADKYVVTFPASLSSIAFSPSRIDDGKATLGRVLFYDTKLSSDGTVSCGSCHLQESGFSDNKAFSRGVSDRQTTRNSFPLGSVANFAAYYGVDFNGPTATRFFWDNRAATIAEQCRGSLTNPNEMDMNMGDVVRIVSEQPYYRPLFEKAFGNNTVTEDRVLEALTHFVNAIGAFDSRFDREASKLSGSASGSNIFTSKYSGFTESENRGKAIYMNNCASCHSMSFGRPVMDHANNGLDATTTDPGVGAIEGFSGKMGHFKVPTLRNIALTAPYMHDGRFATLEAVIEHYSTGIKNHPTLSGTLREGGNPKRFNFTATDKADLLAFLHTLTDDTQASDVRFSNPFK